MLHKLVLVVDVIDDWEAGDMLRRAREAVEACAEVVEQRHHHDTDAEARAALIGVEWGGR